VELWGNGHAGCSKCTYEAVSVSGDDENLQASPEELWRS